MQSVSNMVNVLAILALMQKSPTKSKRAFIKSPTNDPLALQINVLAILAFICLVFSIAGIQLLGGSTTDLLL